MHVHTYTHSHIRIVYTYIERHRILLNITREMGMLWESSIKAKWYLPKLFLFYLEPHNIILSRLPNLWVDFIESHNSACYLIKMSQCINKSNFPKYYITSTYFCTHMACMVSYSVFSVLDLHHSPGCQNTAIDNIYNHVYLSPGSPWNIVRELTGVSVQPPPPKKKKKKKKKK